MRVLAAFVFIAVVGALHLASRNLTPDRRLRRGLATATLVAAVLSLPLFHAPWVYMTVRCGRQPVAVTDLAASYTYWLPSDPGYERSDIFRSYVCTEGEATASGYRRAGG